MIDYSAWSNKNLNDISNRLSWLRNMTDGVIFDRTSSIHKVRIIKKLNQIQLYFLNPFDNNDDPSELDLSGIMSRIDLNNPLNLLGTYTQAMMLALIFISEPKRVYMLGFAGGRIPMLLHHYFPEVVIESTDVDDLTPHIAKKYFGIEFDERQQLAIQDGRAYLQNKVSSDKFDVILVDAFRGVGRIPFQLGTVEFYELCKKHSSPDAVVCVNIINSDPLFVEKVNTFRASFRHIYLHKHENTYVIFGTDQYEHLGRIQRENWADALQSRYRFVFPFFQQSLHLDTMEDHPKYLSLFGNLDNASLLRDDAPPIESLFRIPVNDPIFWKAKPNEPCPCGSKLKFKKCHGKRRQTETSRSLI